jgi:hypothetical protein
VEEAGYRFGMRNCASLRDAATGERARTGTSL